MTPVLLLEISTKINIFLRPVEGFRLEAGQYHQCSFRYLIYITKVRENKKNLIIQGYRILDENVILGFQIVTDKPQKNIDFVYDEGDSTINSITGAIVLEKDTLKQIVHELLNQAVFLKI